MGFDSRQNTTTTVERRSRDRTWDQRTAADHLAEYPHRFELRDSPRSVAWPDVCANCGSGASERVRIRKAFYRRGRRRPYPGFFGYRVVSWDLPLCASCARRHRETVPQVSFLRRYGMFLFNPAHIATIGFAVLLYLSLPSVLETSLAESSGTVGWGLIGVFVFGLVWTVGVTWWMTRPNRFEPRSEISLACDVSHDVSQFFEGRRHLYGCRNAAFASALQRANEGRVWGERDQALMWKKFLVATIMLIVVLGTARFLLWYWEGR